MGRYTSCAHRAIGDNNAAARKAWQSALVIFNQLGHADAEEVRAKLTELDRAGFE